MYNSARQKELKVEEVLPPPDSDHDFCICHCSYKVFWGTRICGVTAFSTGFNRAFTLIFHRSCDRDFTSIQFNSTTLFIPEGQFKRCRSSTHPRTWWRLQWGDRYTETQADWGYTVCEVIYKASVVSDTRCPQCCCCLCCRLWHDSDTSPLSKTAVFSFMFNGIQ